MPAAYYRQCDRNDNGDMPARYSNKVGESRQLHSIGEDRGYARIVSQSYTWDKSLSMPGRTGKDLSHTLIDLCDNALACPPSTKNLRLIRDHTKRHLLSGLGFHWPSLDPDVLAGYHSTGQVQDRYFRARVLCRPPLAHKPSHTHVRRTLGFTPRSQTRVGTRGHGPIDDQPIGLTANGYKCGRMCDGRLAYPHTNTCQKDRPMHNDPKARHPDHDGKKRKGGASQNKTAAPI